MTREQAEMVLANYRDTDDDGVEYGYKIVSYAGPDGEGHIFNCVCDDEPETAQSHPIGVYPGIVIPIPE